MGGVFQSTHAQPSFHATPQTKLDACIQNFSPVSTFLCKAGEEGLQASFEKDALFDEGTQKLQKIMNMWNILDLCPGLYLLKYYMHSKLMAISSSASLHPKSKSLFG